MFRVSVLIYTHADVCNTLEMWMDLLCYLKTGSANNTNHKLFFRFRCNWECKFCRVHSIMWNWRTRLTRFVCVFAISTHGAREREWKGKRASESNCGDRAMGSRRRVVEWVSVIRVNAFKLFCYQFNQYRWHQPQYRATSNRYLGKCH